MGRLNGAENERTNPNPMTSGFAVAVGAANDKQEFSE